jgi:glucosamine-6-phosphate deaminase
VRVLATQGLQTFLVDARSEAERALAREIAELVCAKPTAVLGLATGNTPIGVYAELARLHQRGEIDFARVVTFNLDEYLGLPPGDARSFRSWMRVELFDHVNLARENACFPDVHAPEHLLDGACARYEEAIRRTGGIDLLVLGIGRNGHIAFNEPGSERESRTRVVELAPVTRDDAALAFGSASAVPECAITMGIATILAARRIRVLAFGEKKAAIVARALAGDIGPSLPATFLREHADATLHVDRAAAAEVLNGALETRKLDA